MYYWKINKKGIEDISTKQANGYGNALLKRKEIKPYVAKEKPLIKIWLILFIFLISSYIR